METALALYLVGAYLSWGIASACDEKDWKFQFIAFIESWFAIGGIVGILINEYDKERRKKND